MIETQGGIPSKPRARPRRARPWVVLAEDDDDFRNLLRRWLVDDGYQVTALRSGVALLDHLDGKRGGEDAADLVISDDRMPGMRGLPVLCQARCWDSTLPLILITAFATATVVDVATRAGMAVLPKPFDLDDFRTLVGRLAPRREAAALASCAACSSSDAFRSATDRPGIPLCGACRHLKIEGQSLFEEGSSGRQVQSSWHS